MPELDNGGHPSVRELCAWKEGACAEYANCCVDVPMVLSLPPPRHSFSQSRHFHANSVVIMAHEHD